VANRIPRNLTVLIRSRQRGPERRRCHDPQTRRSKPSQGRSAVFPGRFYGKDRRLPRDRVMQRTSASGRWRSPLLRTGHRVDHKRPSERIPAPAAMRQTPG